MSPQGNKHLLIQHYSLLNVVYYYLIKGQTKYTVMQKFSMKLHIYLSYLKHIGTAANIAILHFS